MKSKQTVQTVPVSPRILLQRINRKLAKDFETVKTTRGDRWRGELGDYYRVDLSRNVILETDVDLELTAKQLGVIKKWESLAE